MTMPSEPSMPAATEAPAEAPPEAPSNPIMDAARAKAAKRSGRGIAQQAQAPQDAPAAPPKAPDAAPAETTEETPQAGPSDDAIAEYKAKHARAVNQARQYERKYRELEQKVQELEKSGSKPSVWESDDFEAKLKEAAKHGITLRALTDYTLKRRGMGDGGADQPQPGQDPRVEKLMAELEELKGARTKDEEQRKQAEVEALRQQEVDVIDRHAKANDRWSLIAEFGRQEAVYQRFYEIAEQQGFAPRLADVMDEVADQIATGAKSILRHGKVRELAKSDPELFGELREFFAAEAGGSAEPSEQPAEAPARRAGGKRNGARAITEADASQTTARREGKPLSKAERKRNALARLKSMQR